MTEEQIIANTGGPAFPSVDTCDFESAYRGISMKDYFAAAALTGLAMRTDLANSSPAAIVDLAYEFGHAAILKK